MPQIVPSPANASCRTATALPSVLLEPSAVFTCVFCVWCAKHVYGAPSKPATQCLAACTNSVFSAFLQQLLPASLSMTVRFGMRILAASSVQAVQLCIECTGWQYDAPF
jgi:hypothetical protein